MIYPNIKRGGTAFPIGNNLFLMKGRKHKNGGIDIGKDLEVEGGEIMQTSPNEIRVFSAQKFLGGESPADLILSGANPDRVFAAQEQYKDEHKINDDGTKQKKRGGKVINWIKDKIIGNKKSNSSPVERNDNSNTTINFDNLKLTNNRSYSPQYLSDIYNGLIKRGINQNQAITIIGTIAEESGGDVFSKSKDNKFTGLLQWEDRRYKIQYPEDRDKELNAQLDYIANTLKNAQQRKNNGFNDDWTDGGENSGYNSWTDAYKDFNDLTNVYNMTRGLNTGYVRPTGGIKGNTSSIKNRMNVSKQIFENNGINDLKYEPNKKQYGDVSKKRNGGNIDNKDNDYFIKQKDYVENQKKWLNNWYDKRLKVIKKEELKDYVTLGMQVPYHTPDSENFLPDSIGGMYLPVFFDSKYTPTTILNNPKLRNNWNKIPGEIYFNMLKGTVPIHEFTHATQYGGLGTYNPQFTNGKDIKETQSYLQRPDEQHARIMELRYINNLDPKKTNYTLEDIQKFDGKNIIKELNKGGMSDEDIVNALNTWASNNKVNNNNNTTKAKFGKQINTNMNKNKNNAYLLGYHVLTGEQKKAYGGRKKAFLGSDDKEYDDLTQLPKGVTLKLHRDLSDPFAYKKPNLTIPTSTIPANSEENHDEEDILAGQNKLRTDHWLTTGIGAGIDFLSGVGGAIVNNLTNKKYLGQMEGLINKMKSYNIPLTKLKTHYNINPQLSEIDNALRIGKQDIDANTASSQVALARKRAAQLNASLQKNQLHGQKENIETDLINKDRLQQGQTIAENVRNAQNVENQKLQLLANLVDKRAENATATIQNITGAVSSTTNKLINGYNQYQQMLAGLAASPNGANAIYGQIGKEKRLRQEKRDKNKNKNNQDNS